MKQFKLARDSTVNSILSQYLNQPHLERSKDPLSFWEANRLFFRELYEMNFKQLYIPGTSVAIESVFYKARQLTDLRKNRLSFKNLGKIIFLNSFCLKSCLKLKHETLPLFN